MGTPSVEARQNLQYICDMLEQLIPLVPKQTGPLLPHLIDMARLEAAQSLLQSRQDKRDTRPPV